jgi:glycosyltransferase involved in cell wall biosynthesis
MNHAVPRIALFLRAPSDGGVERIMLNLTEGLLNCGVAVDLLLLEAKGVRLKEIPPQVRIIDLEMHSSVKVFGVKLPTSFQSTGSLPKLVRYLRQERPTVLLTAAHFLNEIAVLAKLLARVPTRIIISEHTTLSVEADRVEQHSAQFAPFVARCLYPFADEVVAVSHGVANDLATMTGLAIDRIRVIYNPVILPNLAERASAAIDHPWFQPGELPVILGVGRFVEQKDFATLIRAFAQVRQERPARLVLLGKGREKARLLALSQELGVAEDVALLPFTNNPYAYMAKASVVALSSVWEGLPTVLIEAMAVGTPVVATNCKSGPAEILDGGRWGKLVPVGDSSAISTAILQVLAGNTPTVAPNWLEQFKLNNAIQRYLDLLGVARQPEGCQVS